MNAASLLEKQDRPHDGGNRRGAVGEGQGDDVVAEAAGGEVAGGVLWPVSRSGASRVSRAGL